MGFPPEPDRGCVRFGVFELNLATGELRKHGVRVRLQEQPLKLLLCLLETPGEICSREVLIGRIWPEGTFVDYERGLNAAVTRLRQVLGDSAAAPRYVETMGRKGYRFIAPLERVSPAPQAARPPNYWRYASVAALALASLAAAGWWRASHSAIRPLLSVDIDLEPGMEMAGPGTSLALSPDGARLALVVRTADGNVRLVTRRLDQNRLAPLPGAEGASSPFFSPDGQWIAFFAGGKLKKIPARGGAPIVLADAATFARGPRARFPSGSWGDDGNIVAMLYPAAGLVRIPAAGGAPAPLPGWKSAAGEIDNWPQVLPGSQTILFTRCGEDYDNSSLEVFSLRTGRRQTLLAGAFHGRYVPGGRLLFLRHNALFAVSFNPRRSVVSGAPQPLLEDVNSRLADWSFDFSPAGGFVYLRRPAEPALSIFLADRAGHLSPLPDSAESSNASPRFSPAGRHLAYAKTVRGRQDIWVRDLDRGTASRLTSLPGVNDAPVWTPDGSYVIFRSAGQPQPGIYAVPSDGSAQPRRLLETRAGEVPSSISPDGRRLALWAAGSVRIAPVHASGRSLSVGTPEPFLEAGLSPLLPPRMTPAFSPDGRWLAFCSNESDQLELYVVPVPNRGGKWRISAAGGMFPAWTHQGRELFFQDLHTRRIMVADYRAGRDSFAAAPPRVWSDLTLLAPGLHNSYDVSPDGKRLAVVLYADGTADRRRPTTVALLLNFLDELRRRDGSL